LRKYRGTEKKEEEKVSWITKMTASTPHMRTKKINMNITLIKYKVSKIHLMQVS